MDKSQLKQHKSTFHFGASVRYEKILTRGYGKYEFQNAAENGYRKEEVHKEWKQKQVPPRTGIVVGWRWLSNGIGNYDSENGNCYTATESIFAIEVKRSMMNKVDLALPESLGLHLKLYDADMIERMRQQFPLYKPITIPDRIPTMSDKYRKWLRDEMKNVGRDSRGRWK